MKSDEITPMSIAEMRHMASLSVPGLTRMIGQLRVWADSMRPATGPRDIQTRGDKLMTRKIPRLAVLADFAGSPHPYPSNPGRRSGKGVVGTTLVTGWHRGNWWPQK